MDSDFLWAFLTAILILGSIHLIWYLYMRWKLWDRFGIGFGKKHREGMITVKKSKLKDILEGKPW